MERQALVGHANIKKHTRIYLTIDNLFSSQEKRQCIMLNKRRCPCQMVDLTIHDLARQKAEIAWSLKSVCSGFSNNSTSNINQVILQCFLITRLQNLSMLVLTNSNISVILDQLRFSRLFLPKSKKNQNMTSFERLNEVTQNCQMDVLIRYFDEDDKQ